MRYPYSVFRAFVQAGERYRKGRSAEMFELLWVAARGDSESIESLSKRLTS